MYVNFFIYLHGLIYTFFLFSRSVVFARNTLQQFHTIIEQEHDSLICLYFFVFFSLHLNVAQFCNNFIILEFSCASISSDLFLSNYYVMQKHVLIYMLTASSLQNPQRLRKPKRHRRRRIHQALENANISRIDKLVISVTLLLLVTTRISPIIIHKRTLLNFTLYLVRNLI